LPKYTSGGIVYSLVVARAALEDLASIRRADARAADMILALIQEAKVNQEVLESFSVRDFGAYASQRYSVRPWVAQQNAGRNLWRIKIWELEKFGLRYRIIYAFDARVGRYYVLGIFERDFNYDESDPRTKRILASYDSIGISH
jgi:hypothetical protein